MAEPKKPRVQSAKLLKNVTVATIADKEGRKDFPNLFDLLCPLYDGAVCTRQPGRLSVKPDGSAWRVSIECPTEGLQTSFVVLSLPNLLHDSEKILSQGQCHWALTWDRQKKNKPTIESLVE